MSDELRYQFVGGYPTPETVARVRDELEFLEPGGAGLPPVLPEVSGYAIFKANNVLGIVGTRSSAHSRPSPCMSD